MDLSVWQGEGEKREGEEEGGERGVGGRRERERRREEGEKVVLVSLCLLFPS